MTFMEFAIRFVFIFSLPMGFLFLTVLERPRLGIVLIVIFAGLAAAMPMWCRT